MAAYGTLVPWARAMNHTEAASLLVATLEEERDADERLNSIAALQRVDEAERFCRAACVPAGSADSVALKSRAVRWLTISDVRRPSDRAAAGHVCAPLVELGASTESLDSLEASHEELAAVRTEASREEGASLSAPVA